MIIQCGKYELDLATSTKVMGILNVTPDSFSDGGKYNEATIVVERSKQLIADGAHILDIGGESTRPGARKVDEVEEINRVVPTIQSIASVVNVPISIDTYKAMVAKEAIEAGATMINDVWGAKAEPKIAEVAAHYDVPIILMHNRTNRNYRNLMGDMIEDLCESIKIAKVAGVKDDKIILDPGIGFAKTPEMNLQVMNELDKLMAIGYPVLLGTSRKSFIGEVLQLPVNERMEGTGATVCLGIQKGCSIVRVHDVKEMSRMAKMMDAMLLKGK
ncbi:MAG: dihydropteroate synthase [Bacillaceae bacterium]